MTLREYVIKYNGEPSEKKCAIDGCDNQCIEDTGFKSFKKYCNQHIHDRSAIVTSSKAKWKRENPEIFNIFVETMRDIALEQHASMSEEMKLTRAVKTSQSGRANNAKLSQKERSEKFGWMNKLTEKEKIEFIENVAKKTGMFRWWQNASDEDHEMIIRKRDNTILSRYGSCEYEKMPYSQMMKMNANLTKIFDIELQEEF